MKIIKQGTIPAHRLFRVECYHCKTLFEFEQQEAKMHYDQRDSDYLAINCPVCNSNVTTSPNKYLKYD